MKLPAPHELVPHRGPALLLDSIDAVHAHGLVASLTATAPVLSWMGPEIMAQAVSAFATLRQGPPFQPRPGLLLGLRFYHSTTAEFPPGERLTIEVRESTREGGSAVFDAKLTAGGVPVAEAMLTVLQPPDIHVALADQLA